MTAKKPESGRIVAISSMWMTFIFVMLLNVAHDNEVAAYVLVGLFGVAGLLTGALIGAFNLGKGKR